VTPAACLEPKMADTMFPKTLIFSSCVVALRSRGTAGLFVRISRGAMWRGFRCLTQIAVSLVTGICKHRAFRDPGPYSVWIVGRKAHRARAPELFQPIRFECHSAAAYGSFVCELVSVSDAHSYALHGVVMHFACRIRCAESSTYASSEPSHASECGNGFAGARVDWRSIHECGRSSRQHAGA